MEKQIFREKAIDQLSAPEQLNDYLRVTGPGVWFLLTGILVLLAGLFIWGAFGTISTTVTVPAIVSDGEAECHVLKEDAVFTEETVEVRIGDQELTADVSEATEQTLNSSDDEYLFSSGYLKPGKDVVILTCDTTLKDG